MFEQKRFAGRHLLTFESQKLNSFGKKGGSGVLVVSKSGNPGPVPNSYFLYYIFIKALILIKFEHNA